MYTVGLYPSTSGMFPGALHSTSFDKETSINPEKHSTAYYYCPLILCTMSPPGHSDSKGHGPQKSLLSTSYIAS